MWPFIATSIIVISILVMLSSGWRFANYLVGFDGFGGEFNPYLAVAAWGWVGLFYLAYNYMF